jgi:molecular chaperone GrpE
MNDPENEIDGAAEPQNEDVEFEPEEELGDLGAALAKLKKLKVELAKTKNERQEYLDGWQRAKADSVNARREQMISAERALQRAREGLIEDLIPVLDSFDMAVGSESWAEVNDGFRTGMENVRNQLLDVLSRHGVERYGKVGEQFDHALHEAIEERDDVAGKSGEIIRILRAGYRMGDRILRPAQAVVKG